MITMDVSNNITIYDVSKEDEPELYQLFESEDESMRDAKIIHGFEFKIFEGELVLFLCYSKQIESFVIKRGERP